MQTEQTDKLVDLHAEAHLVGALIEATGENSRRLMAEIFAAVEDDDMTHPVLKAGLTAARRLASLEQPIELGTMLTMMRDAGHDGKKVQASIVAAAERAVGSSASGPHFAGRVARLSQRRALRTAARDVMAKAEQRLDDDGYEMELRGGLMAPTGRSGGIRVQGGLEWMSSTWKTMEERGQSEDAPGVLTGFRYIDDRGGLNRRETTALAGRPGAGKTGLALAMAVNAAEMGASVLIVSVEMAAEDLGLRVIAGRARVESDKVRDPRRLSADDWPRLGMAIGKMSAAMENTRIADPDQSDCPITGLMSAIYREHAIRPLDLVVVDYMQIVKAEGERSREREVAAVSSGLKTVAKRTGCAMLALTQMNRDIESRPDPTPQLADLRDSGQIEQDAATIMFVSPHGKDEDGNIVCYNDQRVIYVRKQRHGQADQAWPVRFLGDRGPWFEDM